MIGIVGYGIFIPRNRISVDEICDMWSIKPVSYAKSRYGIVERALNNWDEDAITMAIDAAKGSVKMSGIPPGKIGALFLGTCTNPYVTKASSSIVAEGLGVGPEITCADIQFAAKSGTTSMKVCAGLVMSGVVNYGLAIGSDSFSRHVAPNDLPLEYLASAGAGAYILGTEGTIADIEAMYSFGTETTDFFRLDGDRYLKRGVCGEEEDIGYESHIVSAVSNFLEKFDFETTDFDYVVLHQPDGVRPLRVGEECGFDRKKIEPGLILGTLGDCASGNVPISLAAVLDQAKPNERILVASYGYGSGSDVFSIKTTQSLLKAKHKASLTVAKSLKMKNLVDYKTYVKMERKFIQEYI